MPQSDSCNAERPLVILPSDERDQRHSPTIQGVVASPSFQWAWACLGRGQMTVGRRQFISAIGGAAAAWPKLSRDESEDTAAWWISLPPTSRQRQLALAAAVVLLLGFGVLAPFAYRPLPRLDAFIPFFEAIIFATDFITSVLLFAHYSIYYSRALLVLACGYLFTSLIVIPHVLTFPGVFSPTGLLGAGLQSTAWLYIFWHIGFPAAVLVYAWVKDEKREQSYTHASVLPVFGWSVAIVFSLVCGLTLLATVGDEFLPRLLLDRTHLAPLNSYVIAFSLCICATAYIVLVIGRRSVLDQWLMIVALASILELLFVAVLSGERFSLGFYAGRICSLIASTVVLVVLVAETTRLYARVARSNSMLQRERNNKLMNLEAMLASISHEVRQPLAAIAMNGNAARRFLGHAPPNVEEAQSVLKGLDSDVHRISQVFDSFRALFGRADWKQEPIDVNVLALGALKALRGELKDRGITTRVEFATELAHVMGNSSQLQEVIINLVQNAIDAMDTVNDDDRVLQVTTTHHGADAIILAVKDSGPGIGSERLDNIFDAFVTTKPQGMGLGLALSRMIIERHEGQLSASPAHPRGSVFKVILPAGGSGVA
jgi:signal transduction histidine kinase